MKILQNVILPYMAASSSWRWGPNLNQSTHTVGSSTPSQDSVLSSLLPARRTGPFFPPRPPRSFFVSRSSFISDPQLRNERFERKEMHRNGCVDSDSPGPPDEGPSGLAYLNGHILTEAVPAEAPPSTPPDAESLEHTADDQRQSLLLRLPIEVRRRIYDAVWEEIGLTQHVYVKDGRYTHRACITDHDAPDERQAEIRKIYPAGESWFHDPVWSRRLLSSWVNHWRCEEAAVEAVSGGLPASTPFLPLLLSCKRV